MKKLLIIFSFVCLSACAHDPDHHARWVACLNNHSVLDCD